MMRMSLAAAALVLAAHAASAQDPLSRAKAAATKAANAENAHIANEQKVEQQAKPQAKPAVQQAAKPTAKPATAPAKPASAKSAPAKAAPAGKGGKQQPGSKLDLPSDSTPTHVTIMREVFDYEADGRRDPFVSLLNTSELRPGIGDLRLTGILYDQTGRHSVATLRDLGTNALYRVSVGTTLGRMHVAAIRLKTVVFSIDEFGTTRQDSLILGDTTKARAR